MRHPKILCSFIAASMCLIGSSAFATPVVPTEARGILDASYMFAVGDGNDMRLEGFVPRLMREVDGMGESGGVGIASRLSATGEDPDNSFCRDVPICSVNIFIDAAVGVFDGRQSLNVSLDSIEFSISVGDPTTLRLFLMDPIQTELVTLGNGLNAFGSATVAGPNFRLTGTGGSETYGPPSAGQDVNIPLAIGDYSLFVEGGGVSLFVSQDAAPVSEPAPFGLFLLGLVGMCAARGRANTRQHYKS